MPNLSSVIAANMRRERRAREWSQAELGQRMGWGRGVVDNIEHGRRLIYVDELTSLARVFDITVRDLVEGADPQDLAAWG